MIVSVKPPPELKKRRLTNQQLQQPKLKLGSRGEELAAQFLLQHGYRILDTNLAFQHKELDIIALDTKLDEVVFIEVKTRSSGMFGHPSKAVSQAKLRSMQYVAGIYRRQKKLGEYDYRFDIITVTQGRVEHYRNISWT